MTALAPYPPCLLHPLDETARRRDDETGPAALSPTGWASTAAPSPAIGSQPVC
ncbi:hypothetical protein LZ30DRAFT_737866 [Colletotrichum cereale]|nr:hypothetical protein LZ30DRAFT_737866 [Colletotrichum cereale]